MNTKQPERLPIIGFSYREEACSTESVEDLGSKSVSSYSGFSLDESDGNSERATGDTFKW